MNELEIIAIVKIYNSNMIVFQKNDNDKIYLINKYENFNNKGKYY